MLKIILHNPGLASFCHESCYFPVWNVFAARFCTDWFEKDDNDFTDLGLDVQKWPVILTAKDGNVGLNGSFQETQE